MTGGRGKKKILTYCIRGRQHVSIDYLVRVCSSTHSNECCVILIYNIIYTSYSPLFWERYYMFILYIYSAYHCCSRRENTCSGDPSPYLFFSSGWTKIGQSEYILIVYPIYSSRCTYCWKRRIVKSRTKGSESSLSTLGRMQALLVSYTAYDFAATILSWT